MRALTVLLVLAALPTQSAWAQNPGATGFQRQLRWQATADLPGAGPYAVSLAETAADPQRLYASVETGILVSHDGGTQWTFRPVPSSHWTFAGEITVSASDPRLILTNTNSGDVYRTQDEGLTWTRVLTSDVVPGIRRVAFASSDPDRVYVMSWSAVWRSLDAGLTFDLMYELTDGSIFWTLEVVPGDADQVYVISSDSLLHVTTDGGVSWLTKPVPARSWTLAIDPRDELHLVTASRGGPQVSFDGGDTWSDKGTGFDSRLYVDSVAVDPADSSRLYAGVRSAGLAISEDGGTNWTINSHASLDQASGTSGAILPSVLRPGVVFLGDYAGIFRSDDQGQTFVRSHAGLEDHAHTVDIVVDPFRPKHLVARSGGGVFVSTNAGRGWIPSTGTPRFFGYSGSVAADPNTRDRYYAGTGDGRIHRSDDGGHSFYETRAFDPAIAAVVKIAVHPTVADRLFVIATDSGTALQRSDDGGLTFSPTSFPTTWAWGLAISPADPNVMYCSGVSDVYTSSDGGVTWLRSATPPAGIVRWIVGDRADSQRAWAVCHGTGLHRTDDGGNTWHPDGSGLEFTQCIEIHDPSGVLLANNVMQPIVHASPDPAQGFVPLGFGLPSPAYRITPGPLALYAATVASGIQQLR